MNQEVVHTFSLGQAQVRLAKNALITLESVTSRFYDLITAAKRNTIPINPFQLLHP